MAQKTVSSALLVGVMLLASTRFARAQGAAATTPVDGPPTLIVEPPPDIAPPAASLPAHTVPALSREEPHMIHERRSGLVFAGELAFGLSYTLAVLVSVNLWGRDYGVDPEEGPCRTCKALALSLDIPVAGPLIAYTQAPPGDRPWQLLLVTGVWSAVQAAGAAMLVVGLIGHDVPQEPVVTVRHTKISVVPFVTPEGGMLALRTPW
jgi:hypothetical protein